MQCGESAQDDAWLPNGRPHGIVIPGLREAADKGPDRDLARSARLVGLGPGAAPMTCPFCGSLAVERVGQWGGQIITSQWRCQACNSYFEAVREDFEESPSPSSDRK